MTHDIEPAEDLGRQGAANADALGAVEMMTVEQACRSLDCTPETLVELLKIGTLPGMKFGRSWVIHRDAFYEQVGALAVARMRDRANLRSDTRGIRELHPMQPLAKRKPGRPRIR